MKRHKAQSQFKLTVTLELDFDTDLDYKAVQAHSRELHNSSLTLGLQHLLNQPGIDWSIVHKQLEKRTVY